MKSFLIFFGLVFLGPAISLRAQSDAFPAPTKLGDPSIVGRGIQRTMTLLESSTPETRNTVRILLYGQSITAGPWGTLLEQHLRKTYPDANLIYERRPLSGFASERLVKTSEFDLYPFYADLVIFHDYGNNQDYETMVRKLREQTTAEVIVQADHLRRSESVIDESDPEAVENPRQRNAADRNYRFLPSLARKYGCGFDGRRDLWKAYLSEHAIEPGQLVKDDVHPNEHGTYLMTELIKAYLVKRDDVQINPMDCEYVQTYDIDDLANASDGELQFEFQGNRIDVVFHDHATESCDVWIDGEKPLDDPEMYYHGRNRVKWRDTPIPPGPWPPVMKMGFQRPLVVEKWTLLAKQDPEKPDAYTFEVTGSTTGADGGGRSDQRFVSDSQRIVIEPEDWDVPFSIVALRRLEKLPESFQIDWDVQAQATNTARPPQYDPGVEKCITLAQRLSDGKHTLRLTGAIDGVQSLRVYCPSKFPR